MLPAPIITTTQDGTYEKLNNMSGKWKGFTRTWHGSNEPAEEYPAKGSIHPILGGQFFIHEYEGEQKGNHIDGFVIYGYSDNARLIGIDSFHKGTGILFNKMDVKKDGFHLDGHFNGIDETWNWRSEIDMPDNNTLIISSYNIQPDGIEAKATETIYSRV